MGLVYHPVFRTSGLPLLPVSMKAIKINNYNM
jgi:hypothetical protein